MDEVRSTKENATRTSSFVLVHFTTFTTFTTFTIIILSLSAIPAAAADYVGRVTFGGLPVPGATVIGTHLDQQQTTVTDLDGVFRFTALADGAWTMRDRDDRVRDGDEGDRDRR